MKRTFKNSQKYLVSLMVLVALMGCSVGGTSRSPVLEAEEKPITTISLAIQAIQPVGEIERQIAEFNASHSEWKIKLIIVPRDNYDVTLNRMMTSGEGPDVFQLNTLWLTTYMNKNWLLDLSKENIGSPSYPDWATDYTKQKNGSYFAIPSGMNTLRLIYNKDLLAGAGCDAIHPPATLSELKECAIKISAAGNGYSRYGFALAGGDDEAGFRRPLEIAGTLSGVYYYNFRKGVFDFSVYESWFKTMLEMKKDGGLFPGELALKNDTALSQFAEGNIGMMYATNHDFAQLIRMNRISFSWGVANPPLLDASDKGKGKLMTDLEAPYVINSSTEHKQEAEELWQFLHSSEFQGALFEQVDLIPTRRYVTEYSPNMSKLPDLNAFLPSADESPYPKEPKFGLANSTTLASTSIWSDEARIKTYKEIMQGIKQPETALKEMTEQFNTSLELAIYNQFIGDGEYVFSKFDPLDPLKYANTPDNTRNRPVFLH